MTYSTCQVCGQTLTVTDPLVVAVHPNCFDNYQAPYVDDLLDRFLTAVHAGDDTETDRLERTIAKLHHAPPRLLDAALIYTSWGWPVFPLQPGGKIPMTRHGFKDASTDTAIVRAWWTSTPTANIGLPTGARFDVIDVDPPHGWPTWVKLRDSDTTPPVHGMVTTARGGVHAYIEPIGAPNSAGKAPGIDYRGAGGYVVVPPSRRADGRRWQWITKPSPTLTAAAVSV